jgi:hypothetical protein
MLNNKIKKNKINNDSSQPRLTFRTRDPNNETRTTL